MPRSSLLIASIFAALLGLGGFAAHAAPEVLPLDANALRQMELENIPPFPAELIIKGESKNWESVVHQGDFVVSVYEALPAVLDVRDPFPYDEFVLVLEGEVSLTNMDGDKQTYKQGDTFLVPRGWQGIWDMPVKYREMVIIETNAALAAE